METTHNNQNAKMSLLLPLSDEISKDLKRGFGRLYAAFKPVLSTMKAEISQILGELQQL
jgi:hypothetical protein